VHAPCTVYNIQSTIYSLQCTLHFGLLCPSGHFHLGAHFSSHHHLRCPLCFTATQLCECPQTEAHKLRHSLSAKVSLHRLPLAASLAASQAGSQTGSQTGDETGAQLAAKLEGRPSGPLSTSCAPSALLWRPRKRRQRRPASRKAGGSCKLVETCAGQQIITGRRHIFQHFPTLFNTFSLLFTLSSALQHFGLLVGSF